MKNILSDRKNQPGLVGKWSKAQEETPEQILSEHRQNLKKEYEERKAAAVVKEENDDET